MSPKLEVRRFGAVNWLGFWTLYDKEVRRFLKVFTQTIIAPMATALLFLVVFTVALGGAVKEIAGVPFAHFMGAGLVMMTLAQNAFANTSSSIMISKVQGNIVDVLMPPLSPSEWLAAYLLAGVTRGLAVGAAVWIAMLPFLALPLYSLGAVLLFACLGAAMLSLLGVLGGIWSDKFDHIAAVTNFIVTPLTFLSGTFYSIDRLPGIWWTLSHLNPFFFMIDGFRYGVTGHADADPLLGAVVLLGANGVLWVWALLWVRRGYKLRS